MSNCADAQTILRQIYDIIELKGVAVMSYNVSEYSSRLLKSLSRTAGGIQELLDISYEYFNNPILLSGKSWKVIAMTDEEDMQDDKDWNDFKSEGALSGSSVYMNIRNKLADRIESSLEPFCWKSENMKYERMFFRVLADGKPAATVSVVQYNREFTDSDKEKLKLLCNAIAAELLKNKDKHLFRGLYYEEFFEDILSGRLKNIGVITEREKTLNLGLKENLRVIVVDIDQFDAKHYSVSYIRDTIEKIVCGSRAVIFDEKIVLLVSYGKDKEEFYNNINELSGFSKKFGLKCGVSREYIKLGETRMHFDQGLATLGIISDREDVNIEFYDQVYLDHTAQLCAKNADIRMICSPKLLKLIEYDKNNKTTFTESLKLYFECGRSVVAAADELHVHRNTMLYHLKRIEQLVGINVNDSKLMLEIELSFAFINYL